MIRSLLLAAALLVGCSAPDTYIPLDSTVSVSPELSAEQAEAVIAALDAWSAAVPTIHWTVSVSSEPADLTIGRGDTGHASGRSSYSDRHTHAAIILDPGLDVRFVSLVAEHEIGHALGLQHSDHGLMMPVVPYDATVDARTVADLRNVRDDL